MSVIPVTHYDLVAVMATPVAQLDSDQYMRVVRYVNDKLADQGIDPEDADLTDDNERAAAAANIRELFNRLAGHWRAELRLTFPGGDYRSKLSRAVELLEKLGSEEEMK